MNIAESTDCIRAAVSMRKIAKGIGVGILIGVPLVFAAVIFLSTIALFLFLFGWFPF